MGKLVALVVVAVLVVVSAPIALVALVGGDSPSWGARCAGGGPIEAVLATIRELESSGRYDLPPGPGGASGAYQYIGPTWQTWATRTGIDTVAYPEAWLAPPAVQDQVAAVNVTAILADTGGDVTLIGPVWYIGHVPTGDEWDRVPLPAAGNTLTPRAYQARWLQIFARLNPNSAVAVPPSTTLPSTTSTPTAPGTDTTTTAPTAGCGLASSGWSLPLDGLPADAYLRPHHDYPAIDLPVATGSAVHAIHAGTVTRAGGWAGTCSPDTSDCPDICGLGVVVLDATDPTVEWTYCHLTHTDTTTGNQVAAGTVLGQSGNTGRSTGPHLHIGVRIRGTSACPQPLLYAIATNRTAIPDPTTLPTSGCVT